MEIHNTKDYKLFEGINGNRKLNQQKINNISNDVEKVFNMLPYCPIIVYKKDDKLSVVDGQHRLAVSVKTKNPVYYVICENIDLFQIALLNSRSEKWKAVDFLNCYINLGLKDYENIREVMEKHKVNIKVATDLLMCNSITSRTTELFRNGQFTCSYRQETDQLLELVESIFSRYSFWRDRYLIGAIQAIQKKGVIDWSRLIAKINAKPVLMDKQGDVKGYIYNIERIYNDGVSNRVLLS